MSIKIAGNTSNNIAEVDANNQLKVALPTSQVNSGYAIVLTENDAGAVTSSPLRAALETVYDGDLKIAAENLHLYDCFVGSALNLNIWNNPTGGGGQNTVNAGVLTLNSSSSTVSGAYAQVYSYRQIPVLHAQTCYVAFRAKVVQGGQANKVLELGIGYASGTTAPTDGVGFRWNSDGNFYGFMVSGGTNVLSPAITSPVDGAYHTYVIEFNSEITRFWIDGILQTSLSAATPGESVLSNTVPVYARFFNNGTVSVASSLQIMEIVATFQGVDTKIEFHDTAVLNGGSAIQGQTSFSSLGQTANYANSTVPATATLSNVTPSYSTLGGQFTYAAVVGAETDYALFGWLNPAPVAGNFCKTLLINQVNIATSFIGAAIATTPTVLQWSIAVGSTVASLAGTDSATAKGRRVYPLGVQSFLIAALVGSSNTLIFNIPSPLPVNPGEYCHIILKVSTGTATASQVWRGIVGINGYFA